MRTSAVDGSDHLHAAKQVFTAGFSLSAMLSPVWLDALQTVSHGAALVLPLLGVVVAVLQIRSLTKRKD
jgi:hypothetical protein